MKSKKLILATFILCSAFTYQTFSSRSESKSSSTKLALIKRGEKIVMSYCVLCHGGEDGKLSGKMMDDIPSFIGTFHAPNITNHPEKGIGKYTKEQLRVLLRTRKKADGKKAILLMPGFPLMADEDLEGIIEFLKSDNYAVQSSESSFPPQKLKMLARMMDKKFKIYDMPSESIPLPDTTNKVAWGKYLVTGVFRCYECHSGEMIPDDLNPAASKKYLEGGHTMYDLEKKKVKVPNITPHPKNGIGSWTEDDFYKLINLGVRKNGKTVRFPMAPLPSLTRGESNAIYAYLMTVPPKKNKVK